MSQSHLEKTDRVPPTDWLRFVSILISLPVIIAIEIFKSFFVPWNRNLPLARVIGDVSIRELSSSPVNVIQAILGSTEKAYNKVSSKSDIDILEEGSIKANLLWLGDKSAEHVCLYLHGGGFVMSGSEMQLGFLLWSSNHLAATKRRLAFAVLEYGKLMFSVSPPPLFNVVHPDLAPNSTFPTQLSQAVLALTHLLKTRNASRIHLIGDSAGGNLVLQLISHVLHPIPTISPCPPMNKLASAIMISPLVHLTSNGRSYKQNASSDIIKVEALELWGRLYLEGIQNLEESEPYLEAAQAPLDWFSGIDAVVDRVVVTAGEYECLSGDIEYFVNSVLRPHFPQVVYLMERDAKHIEPMLPFSRNSGEPRGHLPESFKLILNTYEDLIEPSTA